jgi:hypothetical protein
MLVFVLVLTFALVVPAKNVRVLSRELKLALALSNLLSSASRSSSRVSFAATFVDVDALDPRLQNHVKRPCTRWLTVRRTIVVSV